MEIAAIREAFLAYFEERGHQRVDSSSLVPGNDPTLLFTNAGMVQFKDVFLGSDKRGYNRATSSQRCVRAGGKHNDLENVGYTARHHTFFEMLGNFSFGDYFKRDAIAFAWEFLTGVLGLPPEKLWVTVHVSDDEAEKIWLQEIGVSADRFSRLDEDNFWQMGDTGPCGPSSEIFYDHGSDVPGGPPGSPDDDGDRYIEIWNLVFMQFNRDASGELAPLPNPSIDTGMGLERIAAVMQGVHSNYEIDLFASLINTIADALQVSDRQSQSLRVIADHIRSCSFLVLDDVQPGNEGRGYVLRRIIRRAVRHGNKLGATEAFFHSLVAPLAELMGDAYPALRDNQQTIAAALLAEEEQFARTLDQGMRILEQDLADLSDQRIPGDTVFKLYDTYGFPVDLTGDIARERGLELDMEGFEQAMEAQRQRARQASRFGGSDTAALSLEGETDFLGYESLEVPATVLALLRDGQQVDAVAEGEEAAVVLDRTPFYAESGGQVGDCGYLTAGGMRFEVRDTVKQGGHHVHTGLLASGALTVGDTVETTVDSGLRAATARNHSATHLMHAALRQVLGEHVAQKGSLVDSRRLRFDFAHGQPLSPEEIAAIQDLVNAQILANTPVCTDEMSMDEARTRGAMMLFGEKYGDTVRVLSMGGGFSVELCGGTHVSRTGDIGVFHVIAESGIASGVRRIEALSGEPARQYLLEQEQVLRQSAARLKSSPDQLSTKLDQVLADNRSLEKELARLKTELARGAGGDLMDKAETVADTRFLGVHLPGADTPTLRETLDHLKDRMGSGVVILAGDNDGKVALVAGVTKDLTSRFKAGDLIRAAAVEVDGKGGGRPDMAQGGGTRVEGIPAALAAAKAQLLN